MLYLGQDDARRRGREPLVPMERRMDMIVDRPTSDLDPGPDASLRGVKPEERFGNRILIEVRSSLVRLVAGWNLAAITLDTVEIGSDPRLATLGSEYPRSFGERWVVARVSPMSARQLGDPIGFDVFGKRDDRSIHR
jgi:hypothetical protein